MWWNSHRFTSRALASVVLALGLLAAMVFPAAPAQAAPVPFPETAVTWGYYVNGNVTAVEQVGNVVYVGGIFTQARQVSGPSVNRTNVAAFDATTGDLLPFVANTNGIVEDIIVVGNTAYIAGDFTTVNGAFKKKLAAVNATTGALIGGFTANPSTMVFTVEYYNGSLYIGGRFTAVDGTPRSRLAKLNPVTGALDASWNPNASGTVRTIVADPVNNRIYVAGTFLTVAGTSNKYVAALHPNSGANVGPNFASLNGAYLLDVDVSDDGTQVFGAVAGPPSAQGNRVRAWDTTTGSQLWNQQAMGDVQAVVYYEDNIYFGFHEGFKNDTSVRLLAADGDTGDIENSFRPTLDSFFGVWALDAGPAGLVAGGNFTKVHSIYQRGWAIWNQFPAPTNVLAAVITPTSVDLTWNTVPGATSYDVVRDGAVVGSSNTPMYQDTGLTPSTQYTYEVVAHFSSGSQSPPSTPLSVTTLDPPDTTPPSIPGGIIATPMSGSQIDLTWTPSTDDVAVTGYTIFRDGTAVGQSAMPSFSDTGLNAATTYNYTVDAFDAANNVSGPSTPPAAAMTLDDVAPSVPTGLEATTVSTTEIDLIWAASTDNVGVTGYNVYRDGVMVGAVSGTSFSDTLLTAGTSYLYTVEAVDAAGNASGQSAPGVTGTTSPAPDTSPPTAPTAVGATAISDTEIDVTWTASTDNIAVTGYEVYRDGVSVGTTTTTSFSDTGLTASTTYDYTVEAFDAVPNVSLLSSPVASATTLAAPDTEAPSVPTGVATSTVSDTEIDVAWTPSTDNVGVDSYDIYRDGVLVGSSTTPAFSDTGLTPLTTYSYEVLAVDVASNVSALSAPPVPGTTSAAPDVLPPSDPTGVAATVVSSTQIDLSWTASTDNVGVVGYEVYRDGVSVGTTSTAAFSDTGLTPSTTYTYEVEAFDAVPNVSGLSTAVSDTTNDVPDVLPPSVPTNVATNAVGPTQIDVSWTASTDNVGVTGYTVYRDGNPVGTATGTTFSDTGLTASTTYNYTVEAFDAANNVSGESAPPVPGTTTTAAPGNVDLIESGDSWSYLDDGSNQGTAWIAPAFNDAGWSTGPTQIGMGDGDEATVTDHGHITYYFRNEVTVNGSVVGDATMQIRRDDGAAVYVNGTEVWRDNLAAGASFTTRANSIIAGNAESVWHTVTIPGSAFVNGVNTIAVEIHQQNPVSSDITFDLTLNADVLNGPADTTDPTAPTGVTATTVSSAAIDVAWNASSDNVGVTGYTVYRDGVAVGNATGTTYADTGLAAATTYAYTVEAFDAASNVSPLSGSGSATTDNAPAVVYEDVVNADSPNAYWRLGDAGATAADDSGNGLTGNYVGSPSAGETGLITGADTAVRFDGVNDVLRLPNSNLVNLGAPREEHSIELWFNADDVNTRAVVYEQGGATRGANIYVDGGSLYFGIWNTANDGSSDTPWVSGPVFLSSAVNAGTTYHVVLTFDRAADAVIAYVNGVNVAGASDVGFLYAHGAPNGIGAMNGSSRFHTGTAGGSGHHFAGVIDEVAVYGDALTAGEVTEHYNAGL